LTERLDRLTDAYIDRNDRKGSLTNAKKAGVLADQRGIDEQLAALKENPHAVEHHMREFFELAKARD